MHRFHKWHYHRHQCWLVQFERMNIAQYAVLFWNLDRFETHKIPACQPSQCTLNFLIHLICFHTEQKKIYEHASNVSFIFVICLHSKLSFICSFFFEKKKLSQTHFDCDWFLSVNSKICITIIFVFDCYFFQEIGSWIEKLEKRAQVNK